MKGIRLLLVIAWGCVMVACGGIPQPSGDWRPVNTFDKAPQILPLDKTYRYTVMPIDGSLKNLLARWANDSGLKLRYDFHSDFSLTEDVQNIKSDRLSEGLDRLLQLYRAQEPNLLIYLSMGKIIVSTERKKEGARAPRP